MEKTKTGKRQQQATYPLRLPAELKQWLQQKASNNRRSFNAEVVVMLEQVQRTEATNAT